MKNVKVLHLFVSQFMKSYQVFVVKLEPPLHT